MMLYLHEGQHYLELSNSSGMVRRCIWFWSFTGTKRVGMVSGSSEYRQGIVKLIRQRR